MDILDALNGTTMAPLDLSPSNSTLEWMWDQMQKFPFKVSYVFSAAMVLGSVVPYVPQYFTIKKTQNTEGFSIYVCLTLLIANILRIHFWFGKRFETPLLLQSILMILAMFTLLELCVRIRNSNLIIQNRNRYFTAATTTEKPTDNGSSNNCSIKRARSLDEGRACSREFANIPNSLTSVEIIATKENGAASGGAKPAIIAVKSARSHGELDTTAKGNPILNSTESHKEISPKMCKTELVMDGTNCTRLITTTIDNPNINQLGNECEVTKPEMKLNQVAELVDGDTVTTTVATRPEGEQQENLSLKSRHFYDFEWRYFWEWTEFISYVECMGAFAFITGLIMYFFIHVPLVVETYGLLALVSESLLASPQFYRNFKTKSTEGMSLIMVLTWFLGDLYKTIYFIVRQAPFQFLICGCIQITFDTLIFLQVWLYKKAEYRKLKKTQKMKHLESCAKKQFKTAEKLKNTMLNDSEEMMFEQEAINADGQLQQETVVQLVEQNGPHSATSVVGNCDIELNGYINDRGDKVETAELIDLESEEQKRTI